MSPYINVVVNVADATKAKYWHLRKHHRSMYPCTKIFFYCKRYWAMKNLALIYVRAHVAVARVIESVRSTSYFNITILTFSWPLLSLLAIWYQQELRQMTEKSCWQRAPSQKTCLVLPVTPAPRHHCCLGDGADRSVWYGVRPWLRSCPLLCLRPMTSHACWINQMLEPEVVSLGSLSFST